jgi:hypothetical protein
MGVKVQSGLITGNQETNDQGTEDVKDANPHGDTLDGAGKGLLGVLGLTSRNGSDFSSNV